MQAHRRRLAREKCADIIIQHWKKFTKIYQLDRTGEIERSLYRAFTEWLQSDRGLIDFLNMFGHYPLLTQTHGFVTFRRMIDMGLLSLHGGGQLVACASSIDFFGTPMNPFEALGEIAREHKVLGKLHNTLREVDAPLYSYLNKNAHEELLRKLSICLPSQLAEKLVSTPFFTHQTGEETYETLKRISPDSLRKTLARAKETLKSRRQAKGPHPTVDYIVVEKDRICILTEVPETISPEWKDYCDLFVFHGRDGTFSVQPARTAPA